MERTTTAIASPRLPTRTPRSQKTKFLHPVSGNIWCQAPVSPPVLDTEWSAGCTTFFTAASPHPSHRLKRRRSDRKILFRRRAAAEQLALQLLGFSQVLIKYRNRTIDVILNSSVVRC